MDQQNNRGEAFSDIPDKFYFNEMKREVTEASQLDRNAERRVAAEYIDIDALGNMIVSADGMSPVETLALINQNQDVNQQLWGYLEYSLNEVARRRGYACEDPREMMVATCAAAIRVAGIVDSVKIDNLGMEASTAFTNSLMSTLFMNAAIGVATKYPVGNEAPTAAFAAKLASDAFIKTGMETKGKSWAWAKVHTIAEKLRATMTMREVLSRLPDISQADTAMLRRQNDALGEASQSLMTYTPKPAISELDSTGIEALFVDRHVTSHMVITGQPLAELTEVRLFPDTQLTSSNVGLDFKRAYAGKGGVAKRIAIEGSDQAAPQCDVMIDRNRHIRLMAQPLARLTESLGLGGQAEVLTSILLAKNFDLIVPSYIVDLANEEATRIPSDEELDPQADKLRRLLLARTRVLNTLGPEIVVEIDNESEDDQVRHRDIAKHGVVGHLRRIPNGYSPSPLARTLCREQLGIEIPVGHTYVQGHERGNIEVPSRGHKVAKNPKAVGRLSLGIS